MASEFLQDKLARPVRDLRISVTDRCNFRCVYCMPRHKFGTSHQFLPRRDLLTYEEIARVAQAFVSLGVQKLRITGGEPLIRHELERLVELLAGIPGVDDLSMTTNASCLTLEKARSLQRAGLKRITISLDALDDRTFMTINDVDFPVSRVLAGIENAEAVGLAPIKVNMVIKRGVNEHSILPMARFFHGTGHILRFIEYMDVGQSNGWCLADVVPSSEVVDKIHSELPIEPMHPNYDGEVAKRWRYKDGGGEIGIISSVTQPFCGSCARARLSAKGTLYTCLFADSGYDIRHQIREARASDRELERYLSSVWRSRQDRYSQIRSHNTVDLRKIEMSYIGG